MTEIAIAAGAQASEKALDALVTNVGKMRDFVFIVNNLSGHDLRRTGSAGDSGSWPLGDVGKGQCKAGAFDRASMSVAVQYTAGNGSTIALSGSWPMIGSRKIALYKGKSAKNAWDEMPSGSDFNEGANRAMIKEKRGGYVYEFEIKSV